jgi:hypothetical protein
MTRATPPSQPCRLPSPRASSAPLTIPRLPEGQYGGDQGGYDIEIPFAGAPSLLQFKVPEVLTRLSHRRPDGFGVPYYLFRSSIIRFSYKHSNPMIKEAE